MVQAAYNPQEVLSPLMQRFGRHLRSERSEGMNRMVSAVSEELCVDATYARRLIQALASAGLIDFEQDEGRSEDATPANLPGVTPQAEPEPAVPTGVWRIGPSL